MPLLTPETRTYIATRVHPELGLLIKIGSSHKPDQRCSSLGAKRRGPLLPYQSEQYLHWKLERYQVNWAKTTTRPFAAQTEWFKATPKAKAIINAHVRAHLAARQRHQVAA